MPKRSCKSRLFDDKKISYFILGTIFLWLYWPSFNSAILGPGSQQQRALINTYLSLVACTVTTFALSPLFNRHYKLSMVRILFSSEKFTLLWIFRCKDLGNTKST